MHETHASHDQAPADHDECKPDTWACSLEHHIAWDFGGNIEGKEDRESDVVVQPFHPKVLLEIDEAGIADVGAVEVA